MAVIWGYTGKSRTTKAAIHFFDKWSGDNEMLGDLQMMGWQLDNKHFIAGNIYS